MSEEEMVLIKSIREGTFNYRVSKYKITNIDRSNSSRHIIFIDDKEEMSIFTELVNKKVIIIGKGSSFISINENVLKSHMRSTNIDKILEN